jgi:hypothetical protein
MQFIANMIFEKKFIENFYYREHHSLELDSCYRELDLSRTRLSRT